MWLQRGARKVSNLALYSRLRYGPVSRYTYRVLWITATTTLLIEVDTEIR